MTTETLSYVTVDNGACVTTKLTQNLKVTYILKRFIRQFAINDIDVSAGKSHRNCHSISLCRYSLCFGKLRRGNCLLKFTLNETPVAVTFTLQLLFLAAY